MSKTLLVIGQSGQLAQSLAKTPPKDFRLEFAGRDRLNLGIDDPGQLIDILKVDGVINAAAYNAVDAAEADQASAMRVNRDGPAAVARACALRELPFVHVSTDYVFDGLKRSPYVETDLPHPLGVYGQSKLEGERAVLDSGANAAVVRTSWVFGASGTNFLAHMLKLLDGPEEARVVSDQIARPTWAADLAAGVGTIADQLLSNQSSARGLFHLTGADDASRVEMAELIFSWAAARGHKTPNIQRVSTKQFRAAALRPLDTRLDCSKIATLGIIAKPWRDRLRLCLNERIG